MENKSVIKNNSTWIRNDEAPFDIWTQETEIEEIKAMIAMGDFFEFNLLFADRNQTKEQKDIEMDKYVSERKDKVPIERILSFLAGMYGNKPERTITILRGEEVIERWEWKQNL